MSNYEGGFMREHILYTIGHSNRSAEDFLSLLRRFQISVLADVRSSPFSRYCPHFNKEPLETFLLKKGIIYRFLGEELGGRPKDRSCYRENRVSYDFLREKDFFRRGIEKLLGWLTEGHNTALLCSEKDPLECHRFLFISRYLAASSQIDIRHILREDCVETQQKAEERLLKLTKTHADLFEQDYQHLLDVAYDKQSVRISYSFDGV